MKRICKTALPIVVVAVFISLVGSNLSAQLRYRNSKPRGQWTEKDWEAEFGKRYDQNKAREYDTQLLMKQLRAEKEAKMKAEKKAAGSTADEPPNKDTTETDKSSSGKL